MTRFRVCPIALTLAALGTLSMLAGAFLDVDHPAFRFGLIAFLVGASGLIAARSGATNGAIEAARQAGYREGYDDGRHVAHPVVVPFIRSRGLERDGSARLAAPHPAPHGEGLGAG